MFIHTRSFRQNVLLILYYMQAWKRCCNLSYFNRAIYFKRFERKNTKRQLKCFIFVHRCIFLTYIYSRWWIIVDKTFLKLIRVYLIIASQYHQFYARIYTVNFNRNGAYNSISKCIIFTFSTFATLYTIIRRNRSVARHKIDSRYFYALFRSYIYSCAQLKLNNYTI